MKQKTNKKNKWSDHYTRKAKKDDYPARSVYKLQEIQQKNRIIKKGDKVLDLGCSPGSWLMYAAELTGEKGAVTGIDLKQVTTKLPSHVRTITGDIFSVDSDQLSSVIGGNYQVVLSDMAPATTGNKTVDAARSFELCREAFSIAQHLLVHSGNFVCKIFQGEDFKIFSESVKNSFEKHKIFKPKSSRSQSREIYIIGIGKK